MLIATAGHIDHGKTSLVRALTGVETDRLPEEKIRGMTIDLGFAYWQPEDCNVIGFVDVPGHERFVRNMLAGVSAIQMALIVVAADDGIMPQTIEHVHILELLGISKGMIAITKCDRATPERISEVRQQIMGLLSRTQLFDAPIHEVSSTTGAGIADLAEAIKQEDEKLPLPNVAGQNFRLAVDRCFSVTGAGTVVTGTIVAGQLTAGQRLVLSPKGTETRVRGVQSAGHAIGAVQAGQRCAINLAGVKPEDIHRGDWLLPPEMHWPTDRLDVNLRMLSDAPNAIKHGMTVHLHIGTADIEAKVMTAQQRPIAPGESMTAQLALNKPTHSVVGDRFVLRDQAGQVTLGGGFVVNPFTSRSRRDRDQRAAVTAALQLADAKASLKALAGIPGHESNVQNFARAFNLTSAEARAAYDTAGLTVLALTPQIALPVERLTRISREIVDLIGAHHSSHPESDGMGLGELKAKISEPMSQNAYRYVLRQLADERRIVLTGQIAKLPGYGIEFSALEIALWRRLQILAEDRCGVPFTMAEVITELKTSEAALKVLFHRKAGLQEIWQVTQKRFLLRDHAAQLTQAAADLSAKNGGGFTAAQYRDQIKTGRTLAIEILEFFDRVGVTGRRGDLRTMSANYQHVFENANK